MLGGIAKINKQINKTIPIYEELYLLQTTEK